MAKHPSNYVTEKRFCNYLDKLLELNIVTNRIERIKCNKRSTVQSHAEFSVTLKFLDKVNASFRSKFTRM